MGGGAGAPGEVTIATCSGGGGGGGFTAPGWGLGVPPAQRQQLTLADIADEPAQPVSLYR